MSHRRRGRNLLFVVLFIVSFACTGIGQARANIASPHEKILYQFNGGADGSQPTGGVIIAKDGNLYGTTVDGGNSNCGTVFRLSPNSFAGETILHSFTCEPGDGSMPRGSLVLDSSYNLYGITSAGGAFGHGSVFAMTPSSSGWTEDLLYSFTGGNDGDYPNSTLVLDQSGNIYGVTSYGGSENCGGQGCGTVFELRRSTTGWTESVLYSFSDIDGKQPRSLVLASAGNLYGVTTNGGQDGNGTIFLLNFGPDGWTQQVVYNFTGSSDGIHPWGGLVLDSAGNLYGTTSGTFFARCLEPACGTVFELERVGGNWSLRTLHTFKGPDGATPLSELTLDPTGNLFGTTFYGGAHDSGTVFELTPSSTHWTETPLHSFPYGNLDDGMNPVSGLISDQAGNLFGTAQSGAFSDGAVFEIGRQK